MGFSAASCTRIKRPRSFSIAFRVNICTAASGCNRGKNKAGYRCVYVIVDKRSCKMTFETVSTKSSASFASLCNSPSGLSLQPSVSR